MRAQAEYVAREFGEPLSEDHVEHARRNALEAAEPEDADILRSITPREVLAPSTQA
jgi:hypothetical protein